MELDDCCTDDMLGLEVMAFFNSLPLHLIFTDKPSDCPTDDRSAAATFSTTLGSVTQITAVLENNAFEASSKPPPSEIPRASSHGSAASSQNKTQAHYRQDTTERPRSSAQGTAKQKQDFLMGNTGL